MTLTAGISRLFTLLFLCSAALLLGCERKARVAQSEEPGDAKAQLQRYLAKKTGQKTFTPGMDLELPQRVALLRSNATFLEQRMTTLRDSLRDPSTLPPPQRLALEREQPELERAWESARTEAARHEEELSRQEDAYVREVREKAGTVRSYEALYQLVGQQLATADRLLAETNAARQRIGLRLAREACGHVNSDEIDVWLAARICEAYLWPHLAVADTEPGSSERALDLLETCRRVFFDTYETNNVLKNYELLIARAPNARAADTFRVQLADWLEERRSLKHAADILDEIRDTEVLASAQERIVRVKQSVASTP